MFNPLTVIIVFCIYMGGLFLIALLVERKFFLVKNLINNPIVYSLGMAVYCTAWTYYGSVGKAATSGMLFLTIYLGPTLTVVFWWMVLRKLVRIKSTYRITSIADFISARYNKSPTIAAIATIIAFFGTMPYIALQFKAIFSTFAILTQTQNPQASVWGMGNATFIVIGLMILFTIVFGLRRLDPTEKHQGMMAAVAIENTVQLIAFLVAGIFVCFFLYNGVGDILHRFSESSFSQLVSIEGKNSSSFVIWNTYLVLAMSAIMFLPRQFHTAVVENTEEKHIRTAMWLFPMYMFLINIFVLPIAMSGLLKGYDISQADQFVLLLPLQHGNPRIALIVFLGGFSAATSMIMVTSMTMSTMITNHLLLPLVGWFKWLGWVRRNLLKCRWIAAAIFIITGYWFGYSVVGESDMLVNIGLISFAAVLQFAPVILGGIFWLRGNKAGAIMGLTAGFIVWFYTLIIPEFVKSGWLSISLLQDGPGGIGFLNPEHLFGVQTLDPLSHTVFWSLLCNIGFYVIGAFYVKTSHEEQRLAEEFVGILKTVPSFTPMMTEHVSVDLMEKVGLVENLLKQYFVPVEAGNMVARGLSHLGLKGRDKISVIELAALQNEVERLLAGSIGTAVAHKVLTNGSIFTEKESRDLSAVYGEILATLKVTPQELKGKVDYYQERATLLSQHAQELADKIKELEKNIIERKKAEETLQEERRLFIGGKTVVFKWKNAEGWPVEYVSQNVKSRFGFTIDDFTSGKVVYASIIHPNDMKKVADEIKKFSNSGEPYFEQEYQIARADGQYRWIYVFIVVVRDNTGLITHYHGYVSDVTGRKKVEKELKDSEVRLKTLLYSIPAGLMVVDAHSHEIVYVNPVIEEMSGVPREDLVGTKCWKIICPTKEGQCPITDLGQTMDKSDYMIMKKDGTAIPVLKSVTSVVLDDRECLIESLLDITERKKAEAQLKEATDIKLKFISMVSHELRTPLTVIKDGISLILAGIAGNVNDKQREFLSDVSKSVDRLARLINDVLDFQKLEAYKMVFNMQKNDINEIIKEAGESMSSFAKEKGLKLVTELNNDLPLLDVDKDRIMQVLTNLIDNALKFTEKGVITITTSKDDGAICVSVHNPGIEIKKEDLPKLFRKFEQLEIRGQRKIGGTGLGLSICKDIIEQHKGKIWAESDKGTTFYFTIPMAEELKGKI